MSSETGSTTYQITRCGRFERSLTGLYKAHYKKNQKGADKFSDLLKSFATIVALNPLAGETSLGHFEPEPWPKGYAQPGWKLMKFRFYMPQLLGAARYGRIIYLVNEEDRTVELVWAYTHEEFKGRPPEKELGQLLQQIAVNKAT